MAETEKRGSVWILLLLVLLAGAGALVYFFVIEPRIDKHRLTNQRGKPAGAVIDNGLLTTIDWVDITKEREDSTTGQEIREEVYKTRVTTHDLTTGKQLEQTLFDGSGTCTGATPDTLWCNFGHLTLVDRRTLKKLADVEDAVAKAGIGATLVKQKEGPDQLLVGVVNGGKATLLVDDGRVAVFDAATQKVIKLDDVPKALTGQTINGMQVKPPETLKLAPSSSCGTRGGGGGRTKLSAGKITSKDSYLGPTAIGTLAPPLFVHHTSLDETQDSLQLSRLDASGGTTWIPAAASARATPRSQSPAARFTSAS